MFIFAGVVSADTVTISPDFINPPNPCIWSYWNENASYADGTMTVTGVTRLDYQGQPGEEVIEVAGEIAFFSSEYNRAANFEIQWILNDNPYHRLEIRVGLRKMPEPDGLRALAFIVEWGPGKGVFNYLDGGVFPPTLEPNVFYPLKVTVKGNVISMYLDDNNPTTEELPLEYEFDRKTYEDDKPVIWGGTNFNCPNDNEICAKVRNFKVTYIPGVCYLDSDGDGILDDDDSCPFENASNSDANGDGCIDTISDFPEFIDDVNFEKQQHTNSFYFQLEEAQELINRNEIEAAKEKLNAFIIHVNAQSGKKIPQEDAVVLIEYVNNLINSISFEPEE